jgi:sensor histidine kinase YesM
LITAWPPEAGRAWKPVGVTEGIRREWDGFRFLFPVKDAVGRRAAELVMTVPMPRLQAMACAAAPPGTAVQLLPVGVGPAPPQEPDRVAAEVSLSLDDNEPLLRVRVSEPKALRFAAVHRSLRRLAIAIAWLLALVCITALTLTRLLTAPLAALSKLVGAYAKGDYHFPRPKGRFRELDEFAVTLSELGERVTRQIEEAAEQERIRGELERAQIQAELNALREQMQPHFIFNALNNIAAMIPFDGKGAAEMLTKLAALYRMMLEASKTATAALTSEVKLVEHYLELQRMRYGNRLRYSIGLEDGEGIFVPSLVLQTLVENAVKHGISKARAGGEVQVQGVRAGSLYRLTVRNSGAPLASGGGGGTGLANTRKRLDLLYGEKHRFRLFSDAVGATVAEFQVTGECL